MALHTPTPRGFSALQRAEIAEMVLNNELTAPVVAVSVLFNEPKLLKLLSKKQTVPNSASCFSALQRAEIAEMFAASVKPQTRSGFSALQRAEIAEITLVRSRQR